MKDLIPVLKDRAIFLGWVAGLVLIASLLWSFTYSFRASALMRSTNKVLLSMNDERRLAAPLPRPPAGAVPLGCWYTLAGSQSYFFVFTIIQEGVLIPCGAEISSTGKVHIVPLGSHALQIVDRIPQSLMQIYVHRIESVAASLVTTAVRRNE